MSHGPLAVAVPGYVKGVALALERFGTWDWRDAIEPACKLAEQGLPLNWYATYLIGAMARGLAMYQETKRTYLADGLPPVASVEDREPLALGQPGPRPIGRCGTKARKRSTTANWRTAWPRTCRPPVRVSAARTSPPTRLGSPNHWRRATATRTIFAPGHLTGGPDALPSARRSRGEARAIRRATRFRRFRRLRGCVARLLSLPLGAPWRRRGPRARHTPPTFALPMRRATSFSLTQTIMSGFGSRIMLPGSGVLMNNGMMWFDPRPGGPNSVVGGRRPLCNMLPVIGRLGDGSLFAVGACGGRRILASVFQLVSFFVDYGMNVDDAVHCPRLDVSGTDLVTMMAHMPAETVDVLRRRFGETCIASNGVSGFLFALPQTVLVRPDGGMAGGCFVASPTARVVAA